LNRLANKDKVIEGLRDEVKSATDRLASAEEQLTALNQSIASLTEANSSLSAKIQSSVTQEAIPADNGSHVQVDLTSMANLKEENSRLEAEKSDLTSKLESIKKDGEV
jgi:chromosome segregation ATPase